ncbi:MAG: NAD(+)/NADH kinase [Lachnospiraceae bacterium]|nr:NAD(+)/NADH kinase [Lachnospiraceae bacterium]
MDRIFTITNPVKDHLYAFTDDVSSFLTRAGVECISVKTGEDVEHMQWQLDPDRDCVIVIGGDGTVLRAAHTILGSSVPLLGINLGTLGYLAEVEKTNWREKLTKLLSGDYTIETRMMLEGRYTRKGGKDLENSDIYYALNEAFIARGPEPHVLHINLYVDDVILNKQVCDGAIISTPTGSTAYNLSAGGPIVEPKAQMLVATPICSHTLNSRSIVLSAEDVITLELLETHRGEQVRAVAVFDGETKGSLQAGDRIAVKRSEKITRLVKLTKRSFLTTLHRKMSS